MKSYNKLICVESGGKGKEHFGLLKQNFILLFYETQLL